MLKSQEKKRFPFELRFKPSSLWKNIFFVPTVIFFTFQFSTTTSRIKNKEQDKDFTELKHRLSWKAIKFMRQKITNDKEWERTNWSTHNVYFTFHPENFEAFSWQFQEHPAKLVLYLTTLGVNVQTKFPYKLIKFTIKSSRPRLAEVLCWFCNDMIPQTP